MEIFYQPEESKIDPAIELKNYINPIYPSPVDITLEFLGQFTK